MSSEHDPVKPTHFEAVEPIQQADTHATPAKLDKSNRLVIGALLALLMMAAMVVLWLPGQIEQEPAISDVTPDAPASTNPAAKTPVARAPAPPAEQAATSAAPPFAQAREARLRQNAQDVLTPMLDAQFGLREQGAERWAGDAFKAAGDMAVEGDLLYRDRQFEAAQAKYQGALDALRVLQQTAPNVLEGYIEQAETAIESGDANTATKALELASLIAPEDLRLPGLKQRLAQVPAVAQLIKQADQLEREDELAQALAALEQALQMDKEHLRVATDLQRVSAALSTQNFSQAMGAGYAALAEQRFKRARELFQQAGSFSTGSPEAASALREVTERETAYRLQQFALQGETAQNAEQWQDAVAVYEKALILDSNVLFATQGLALSRPRAKMAAQLEILLKEPKRLEDKKVAAAAKDLLAQGRQVQGRAPVLQAQLEKLDTLLVKATTPVSILLHSDQQTDVVVHTVARLGRFDRRSLELRPGTYTIVGSRRGYRDVRREFTVSHEQSQPEVTIACTEPI